MRNRAAGEERDAATRLPLAERAARMRVVDRFDLDLMRLPEPMIFVVDRQTTAQPEQDPAVAVNRVVVQRPKLEEVVLGQYEHLLLVVRPQRRGLFEKLPKTSRFLWPVLSGS